MTFYECCQQQGFPTTPEYRKFWDAASVDNAKYELSVLQTILIYLETGDGIETAKTIVKKRINVLVSDF